MSKGNEIGFDIRGPRAVLTKPSNSQNNSAAGLSDSSRDTSYALFSVLVGIPLTSAYPIRVIGCFDPCRQFAFSSRRTHNTTYKRSVMLKIVKPSSHRKYASRNVAKL
jgi:hypothetical protein